MLLFLRNTVEISIVCIYQNSRCRVLSIWDNCTLKRTQFRVKEFYSYEKDFVFRFCVKDVIFIYYVPEKSLDFGRFIMPGNKLLPCVIFINDLNR